MLFFLGHQHHPVQNKFDGQTLVVRSLVPFPYCQYDEHSRAINQIIHTAFGPALNPAGKTFYRFWNPKIISMPLNRQGRLVPTWRILVGLRKESQGMSALTRSLSLLISSLFSRRAFYSSVMQVIRCSSAFSAPSKRRGGYLLDALQVPPLLCICITVSMDLEYVSIFGCLG